MLVLLLLLLSTAVSSTFFNLGCGCPPPSPCLPPIQLPQLCLPRIQLPQINFCNPCGRKKRSINTENGLHDFENTETVLDKATCNNEVLEKIMKENMFGTPQEAKIRIAEAAESEFGGHFSVICSKQSFSYLSTTSSYCLVLGDLNCYAFHTDNKEVADSKRR